MVPCPEMSHYSGREKPGEVMTKHYPYGKGDGIVKWVSTGWLSDHLSEKNLSVLDCQPNVHEYIQDHIPGAIYVPEGLFRIHVGTIPSRWIPPGAAQILFRIAGLDPEQPVIVYGSSGPLTTCGNYIGDGLEQTMLAYTLARYGHRHVLVLDGGLEQWKNEKRPLTRRFTEAPPSRFAGTVREDFLIGYEGVRQMKDRPDVVLLDARPPPV